MKLLTLVVPSYNMEDYIGRCLDSVTAPDVPDSLEVIVVNDGSKDRTLDIAYKYQDIRPDVVKIIDKDNGHYGSCVNAGLKVASGKYFRMLDADDWMDTEALIALLGELESCDTDLVVTLRSEHLMNNENKVYEIRRFPLPTVEYGHIYDMSSFDIAAHVVAREFNMHAMTYRTSFLKDIIELRHLEGVCYTDLQYCFIPIDRVKTFVVYGLYLYNYVIGRDEQSTSLISRKRNFSHINKVLTSIFRYLESGNVRRDKSEYVRKNQDYFFSESVDMFFSALRMQDSVSSEDYKDILYNCRGIKKYGISSGFNKKIYFRLWKLMESRMMLNIILRIYRLFHIRRMRKMGI